MDSSSGNKICKVKYENTKSAADSGVFSNEQFTQMRLEQGCHVIQEDHITNEAITNVAKLHSDGELQDDSSSDEFEDESSDSSEGYNQAV